MSLRAGAKIVPYLLTAALFLLPTALLATEDEPQSPDRVAKVAQAQLLLDVARAGSRLVAVGRFGHILLSDDKGESWRLAESVPTGRTLTAVHFPEPDLGFAVGYDSIILRTRDGGETWDLVHEDAELASARSRTISYTGDTNSCAIDPEPDSCLVPLLTVFFADRFRGFAMGTFGLAYETRDGGDSWQRRELFPGNDLDYHINGLFRASDGILYAPAELGVVYRSLDEGETFEPVETGYEGSFWGGLPVDEGSVLAFGMRGNVWRSDDKGETWTKLDSSSVNSFHDAVRLANGDIALAGLSGSIAYSRDGGRTFIAEERSDRISLAAIAEGQEKLVLFGLGGILYQSLPLPSAR